MRKRIFRARYKIDEPGVISHITQRAPGREVLFLEKDDYFHMLGLIKEIAGRFSLEIISFVLMPNHVHILLRQLKKNLKIAMKSLYERYANKFNDKYERKGHVFCGPFRQAVCLDESYLFAITTYIHINAVKDGLVINPLDYPWSSVRPYLMPIKRETFLNYRLVLNLLNKDITRAREIYWGILKEAIKIKTGNVLEDEKAMEAFKSSLNGIIHRGFRYKVENIDIFDIEIDKKIEEIRSKKRLNTPQEIEARKYLVQQLTIRGYKPIEIAAKLGISRKSVYNYTE